MKSNELLELVRNIAIADEEIEEEVETRLAGCLYQSDLPLLEDGWAL